MKKRKLRLKNIFMIAFIVYAAITIVNQQLTIYDLRKSEQDEISKIEAIRNDNDRLMEMINNATSVEYIEKLAREQLGLVKPGEKVYIDQSSDEKE
ncbi:MAG TPA: septum formation initiator family protein [Bacillota bacterium]|nr:septum formation initiator family protein [Clostridiaceae bacterium]HNR04914.1 septum formation initiator family protein [Bacillota bacterium]HNT03631.1 septum formation initiator family protein [Bacillota bacterium]HNU80707.1 septum formation initiator family protein [Bacillota bacterium]HPW40626.1 septum formation initiator family protein [Bacillota bacterium]